MGDVKKNQNLNGQKHGFLEFTKKIENRDTILPLLQIEETETTSQYKEKEEKSEIEESENYELKKNESEDNKLKNRKSKDEKYQEKKSNDQESENSFFFLSGKLYGVLGPQLPPVHCNPGSGMDPADLVQKNKKIESEKLLNKKEDEKSEIEESQKNKLEKNESEDNKSKNRESKDEKCQEKELNDQESENSIFFLEDEKCQEKKLNDQELKKKLSNEKEKEKLETEESQKNKSLKTIKLKDKNDESEIDDVVKTEENSSIKKLQFQANELINIVSFGDSEDTTSSSEQILVRFEQVKPSEPVQEQFRCFWPWRRNSEGSRFVC